MSDIKFNTIEEAIADFKAGKMVIAVDDDDLENEGSLLVAGEFATPEVINFMATEKIDHSLNLLNFESSYNKAKSIFHF